MIKTFFFSFLILTLIGLNSACTSTPYSRGLTPSIDGIIDIEHKAGIKLFLSRDGKDSRCTKSEKTTITDDQGRFHFAAIRQQMSYTPLMTYYLNEWVICAELQGTKQMIYSGNHYGQGSVVATLHLICDRQSPGSKQINCRHQSALDD